MLDIKLIDPEMTYSLRHKVLRPHQTIEDCNYDTDHEDSAFHIGAFLHEELISIASFCDEKIQIFQRKFNTASEQWQPMRNFERWGLVV